MRYLCTNSSGEVNRLTQISLYVTFGLLCFAQWCFRCHAVVRFAQTFYVLALVPFMLNAYFHWIHDGNQNQMAHCSHPVWSGSWFSVPHLLHLLLSAIHHSLSRGNVLKRLGQRMYECTGTGTSESMYRERRNMMSFLHFVHKCETIYLYSHELCVCMCASICRDWVGAFSIYMLGSHFKMLRHYDDDPFPEIVSSSHT